MSWTAFIIYLCFISCLSLGLATVLEKELLRIDPSADLDVMCDKESGRVWGRGSFSSAELAARACSILHTSILGTRELSVFPAPVVTDALPFSCRVLVTMSSVPHNGYANINCGSARIAQQILMRAMAAAPTAMPAKKWYPLKLPSKSPSGLLVKVCEYTKGKGGDVVPSWIAMSGISPEIGAADLENALNDLHLGLPRGAVALQKDKENLERESKSLKQSGVNGTRNRIAFLHGIAGEALDHVSETGLEGGARYTLWFHTPDQAIESAQKLHGRVMPKTGLVVSAAIDNSCNIMFPSDVYHILKAGVALVRASCEGVSIDVEMDKGKSKSKTKGAMLKLQGADMGLMAIAYRKLKALQNGALINVAVKDRGKLFPPKVSTVKCERVAELLKSLSRDCIVRPEFSRSAIRVIGTPKKQAEVAEAINTFLKSESYERRIRIPRGAMADIRKFVSQPREDVSMTIEGSHLIVRSIDEEKMVEARSLVSKILEEKTPKGLSLCSVCFEVCDLRLGTCGHTLCEDCGQQFCQSSVCENRVPITDPSCGAILLLDDLSLMSDRIGSIYMAGVRCFLRSTEGESYGYCHTPDCPQILDKRTEAALCSVCMSYQCPLCGEDPHPRQSCESAKQQRCFEQSIEGQVSIHVKAITEKFLTPSCPSCGVSFVDFSGCFAVTCSNCASNFCGYCLLNCGRSDAHPHVASCEFSRKHFGIQGYFSPGDVFAKCMQIRLPELAKEYLDNRVADREHQRVIYRKCEELMKESPFFSTDRFKELLPHLK